MNLHHKKRSLLDNLVYTSPRKKEPIRKYNIEPLPMNDLQQIAKIKQNLNNYYNL